MANVIVSGNAVVIKSAIKFEELKAVAKYRPGALTLLDEDKTPKFIVGFSRGGDFGSLSQFGALFNDAPDANGAAVITMTVASFDGNPAEAVADQFGGALAALNEVEKGLPKVLAEIDKQKEEVLKTITIQ